MQPYPGFIINIVIRKFEQNKKKDVSIPLNLKE